MANSIPYPSPSYGCVDTGNSSNDSFGCERPVPAYGDHAYGCRARGTGVSKHPPIKLERSPLDAMCPEDPEPTQGERAYSMADQAEGNAWIDDYDDLLTTCSVCGEPFGARHLWLRSELHAESRMWYECHLCPTKFTRAHLLERHVKKHTSASQ